MGLKRLFAVVALLAVGLLGCGPDDGAGQVGLPVHITVNSPSAVTTLVNLDFELFGEQGLQLDEGEILSGAMVRDGETFVVDSAIFASPGDEVSLGFSFTVDETLYTGDRILFMMDETITGVEINVTNREDLGRWLVYIGPMTGTDETPVE